MLSTIPSRVHARKGIQVSQSNIPGAGRGLFATEEIQNGELIFSIAQPLLNTVDGDEIADICDHCFAIRKPDSPTVPTVPGESIKLLRCSGCKEVYYCNQKCQSSAWKHHHKYECKTFVALKIVTVNGVPFLQRSGIRCLTRLVLIHPRLPLEERAEYAALQTHHSTKIQDPCFVEVLKLNAEVLKKFIYTKLSEEEIKDLYCAIASNQLSLILPILKGNYPLHPNFPLRTLYTSGGTCLEPFAALLNHSCDSNSVWSFDGPSLNICARRSIAAGDELTIPYTTANIDFQVRQDILFQNYHFTCTCPLCMQGNIGPVGSLRTRILTIIENGMPESFPEIQGIETAIEECKRGGFSGYPMQPLHLILLSGYLKFGDYKKALRLALALRYFVEPLQTPPTSPEERLQTLHHLIQLLQKLFENTSSRLLISVQQVYFQFREVYARETEWCYGADSIVGTFERESFELAVKTLESESGIKYAMLEESKGERERFYVNVNELLKSVQLPAVMEKDLI